MLPIHHSAAVHVPLTLAVLIPFVYLTIVIFVRSGAWPLNVWWLLWMMSGIAVVTNGLSYVTGTRDMVLSAAAPEVLADHRLMAWYFVWASVMVAIVVPLAFTRSRGGRPFWVLHGLLLTAFVLQLFWAVRLGSLGGKLVFGG